MGRCSEISRYVRDCGGETCCNGDCGPSRVTKHFCRLYWRQYFHTRSSPTNFHAIGAISKPALVFDRCRPVFTNKQPTAYFRRCLYHGRGRQLRSTGYIWQHCRGFFCNLRLGLRGRGSPRASDERRLRLVCQGLMSHYRSHCYQTNHHNAARRTSHSLSILRTIGNLIPSRLINSPFPGRP
jgi:hypothetical protein